MIPTLMCARFKTTIMPTLRLHSHRRTWPLLLLLLCCSSPGFVWAKVPRTIHYQGKLTESNDAPLTGDHDVTLRLYAGSSGGATLWEEVHSVHLDRTDNGVFSVELGSIVPFGAAITFNDPLWLTTEVDGAGEMAPRQPISAASYAINADLLDGLDSTQLLASATGGGPSAVTAGAGLTGGGTTGSVTLDVGAGPGLVVTADAISADIGTTAGKLVQLDAGGALPAVSGANLTSLNAAALTSGTVPDAQLPADVSRLGSSIESSEITDGTITNDDIASTAAIDPAKIGNLTTDLSAKVAKAGDTMTGTLVLTKSSDDVKIQPSDSLNPSFHVLRVLDSGGTTLQLGISKSGSIDMAAGATVDGVDIGVHDHSGGVNGVAIPTAGLADGAVTSAKIADDTITAVDTTASFLTAGSGVTIVKGAASWDISAVGSGGDITAVTAGAGLTGGGTSGAVTLSLSTPVAVGLGGTGATTASAARTNLGAAASGTNSDITSLSNLTTPLSVAQGGTGAATAAAARSALGVAASGANSDLTSLTGLTTPLSVGQGGTGATSAAAARSALGAAASGANSDITALNGLTAPLAIAEGGTGAATAAAARVNLINCMAIGGTETTSRSATFEVSTFGPGSTSGTAGALWPLPVSGTMSSLQAFVGTAPGSGRSWTVTLRRNGADTTATCSIAGTGQACTSAASVSVNPGDRVGVRFTEVGSASGTSGASWGACFVPN